MHQTASRSTQVGLLQGLFQQWKGFCRFGTRSLHSSIFVFFVMTHLTPNFSLEELCTTKQPIDNTPSDAIKANLLHLAIQLEGVRALLGKPMTISSAFRSDAVNKAVGGSKTSDHLQGFAADFTVAGMSPLEICKILAASNLSWKQLIQEHGAWVHIAFVPGNTKREVLTAKKVNGKTKYFAGLV